MNAPAQNDPTDANAFVRKKLMRHPEYAQNDEPKCTCKPKNPHLRNGSGHYEGCPLWYPLNTPPQNEVLKCRCAPVVMDSGVVAHSDKCFYGSTPLPVTEKVDEIFEKYLEVKGFPQDWPAARFALSALLEQARRQALQNLKVDYGNHCLSVPADEWMRIGDFIDVAIAALRKEQA